MQAIARSYAIFIFTFVIMFNSIVFTSAILTNNVNSTLSRLCENDSPANDSPRDFTRISYICDNTVNVSVDNSTTVKLWIDFINCSAIPEDLTLNFSSALQTLVVSAPMTSNFEMTSFPRSLLRNLVSVTELQLRGFEYVQTIDKHMLSSLVNIRCLYFEGFRKYDMPFSQTLSVLKDLAGTPLTSVVMNDVKSIRNKDKKLNLKVFAIPNVTLTRLVIDNSVVSSLVGRLSKIQPSLTSLSLSLTSKYDDMLETLFDTVLIMPNLRTLHLYGYSSQAVFNLYKPQFINFVTKHIQLLKYITANFNHTCRFQTKISFSRSLRHIAINNIQLSNYTDTSVPDDSSPFCFDERNEVVHFDLTNSRMQDFRFIGLLQLEILNIRNASIDKFFPQHLKEFPRLKTFLISDNDLGEHIEMDTAADAFRYGHTLVVLDLARCNLSRIPHEAFVTLISLQYLNLTGNNIQVVDWVLQNCTQLQLLDLSYNKIEQLSDNFTRYELDPLLTNSEVHQQNSSLMIDLSGNPLSCLCNATSFVHWMQSRKPTVFVSFRNYDCLYPNGTWVKLETVNTNQLISQCTIIEELENNTHCPCDLNKLNLLYAVRYSLTDYYCNYPDGKLISLKFLEPNFAWNACLISKGLPSFVVPVVVSVSLMILIVMSAIFVFVYRRKRPKEFRQLMECLDLSRLAGALMAILNSRAETPEELTEDTPYDAFFAFCREDRKKLDEEVLSKLIDLGLKIVTEDEIEAGAFNAEILSEITRKCRSIVLILTPEFVQDDWLRKITNHTLLGKCALVPFVLRPLDLDENEFMFSNIIKNYLPIYWTEETEEREKALADLSERLLHDTLTWVKRSIAMSVEESF